MREADLAFAAQLHLEHLPHGFLPEAGEQVLRTYWRGFATSPHAIGMVAEVDGHDAGVLAGTLRSDRHWRHFLRHCGVELARRLFRVLLTRPGLLFLFVRSRLLPYVRGAIRLRRDDAGDHAGSRSSRQVATLNHMAVEPELRGRGAGRRLVESFLARVHEDGIDEAQLVTLDDDRGAGGYYQRHGWEPREVRERDGEPYRRYVIRLDDPDRPRGRSSEQVEEPGGGQIGEPNGERRGAPGYERVGEPNSDQIGARGGEREGRSRSGSGS